jgi:Ca2+-binding EF-hand superfamily protein
LYATPITFDIVTAEHINTNNPDPKKHAVIPLQQPQRDETKLVLQPPYNFGTTQVEVNLKVGVDYYIVPSLYKRNQSGTFYLNVYADVKSFFLEGATTLVEAQKPMVVGKDAKELTLKMSVSQFYEKKEILRERIINETKRLNLTVHHITQIFKNCNEDKMLLPSFKKKMMDLGFQLADFPDDDLVVLDLDNDGTISPSEFIKFIRPDELSEQRSDPASQPIPEKPVDDLLYKAIDLSGELNLHVSCGRSIREPESWVNSTTSSSSSSDFLVRKGLIKYSSEEAQIARGKSAQERYKLMSELTSTLTPKTAVVEAEKSKKPSDPASPPKHSESVANLKLITGQSPRSLMPNLRNSETLQSLRVSSDAFAKTGTAHSVLSEISQSQSEAVKQAGASAAAKLHSDPQLQKAELNRTKYLSSLRSYNRKKQDNAEEGDKSKSDSILRRKNVTSGKVKIRDFSKDIDAQVLLNYFPKTPVAGLPSHASEVDSHAMIHYLASDLSDGGSFDLWDYLIDCVVTISESRANSTSSSQHEIYSNLKKKKGISVVSLNGLNPVASIPTNTPTPVRSKNGQMTVSKRTKGHTPTPRSQRRVPGTASVTTVQTKAQQRNSLLEAKEKLQVLQQEQIVYEEVFRRLVAIPTIEEHEIFGEKKSQKMLSSSAGQPPAVTANLNQIYSLFLKFDRNLNGYVSKQEFQLVFKELKIEFTNEDCDIFFNRFASYKSAENIDWKEFLNFFQKRILISTQNESSLNLEDTSLANDFLFAKETNNSMNKMVLILVHIQHLFHDIFEVMLRDQIYSLDKLLMNKESTDTLLLSISTPVAKKTLEKNKSGQGSETRQENHASNILNSAAQIPNNAVFQALSNSQAKQNISILSNFGLKISVEDMCRINRIFNYDLTEFMNFIRTEKTNSEPNLMEIVNFCDLIVAKELTNRIGIPILRPVYVPDRIPLSAPDKKPSEVKTVTVGAISVPFTSLRQDLDPKLLAPTSATTSGTLKVWSCLSNNKDPLINYDAVLSYFQSLLDQSHYFKIESKGESAGTKKSPELYGIKTWILLRIIVDSILASDWNRPVISAASNPHQAGQPALPSSLSFSGLDAYIRNSNIQKIERKLKYLLLLEKNLNSSFTYLLLHVCVNTANSEVVVICHDPLTNEIYKLQCREESLIAPPNTSAATPATHAGSMKDLPTGEKIKQSIVDYYTSIFQLSQSNKQTLYWNKNFFINNPSTSSILINDSFYLYNPIETPMEDRVIQDFINRIKLIRRPLVHGKPSELILCENPSLVKQLKDLFDAHSEKLSLFYILNDLSLRFEINNKQLQAITDDSSSTQLTKSSERFENENNKVLNIRNVIFNQLRGLKSLHSFLISIKSSLVVILSTYNSTIREVMNYDEFLLHMLNYRNCFLTVRLLPEYIKPSKYLYEPPNPAEIKPEDADEEDDPDEDPEQQPPKKDYESYYISRIDYDGLPHPKFDQLFSFFYQQSKLTSCRIVTTEVVKMNIDEIKKFVMVVVREGKRSLQLSKSAKKPEQHLFWFLTLYDPRTATEYQCGVKAEAALYKQLYYHKFPDNLNKPLDQIQKEFVNLEILNENLRLASEKSQLILGPAITPRLEFQLYNYKDSKCQELIGETQISISSVLSNSGVGEKMWTTLIYKLEKVATSENASSTVDGKKKIINFPAGELEIELSFRRSLEMESDELLQKTGKGKKSSSSKKATPLPSARRGDQDIPPKVAAVSEGKEAKESPKVNDRMIAIEKENDELRKKLESLQKAVPRNETPRSAENQKPQQSDQEKQIQALLSEKSQLEVQNKKLVAESKASLETINALKDQLAAMQTTKAPQKDVERKPEPVVKEKKNEDNSGELRAEIERLKAENKQLLLDVAAARNKNSSSEPTRPADPAPSSDFLVINQLTSDVIDPSAAVAITQTVHQILSFLYKKYERRMLVKSTNGASTVVDHSGTFSLALSLNNCHVILENLGKLMYAFSNAEGYIDYKQLGEIFSEFNVFVENEILLKIVNSILGNYNNMNSTVNKRTQNSILVHNFMDYLHKELVQFLKQSSLLTNASRSKLRSSIDSSDVTVKTLTSNDDANLRSSFAKDEKGNKKPRPGSAAPSSAGPAGSKSSTQPAGNKKAAKSPKADLETSLPTGEIPEAEAGADHGKKDWSQEPLPDNWERRFHAPRQRVSLFPLALLPR